MSYTRVYEEMFEFNFIVGKSSLQEKANFGDCLGARFQTLIWRPGDKKIWRNLKSGVSRTIRKC